ncbi:nephrin-like [Uloborus diversus]|uniref:nephrin-like n=1 Tax=Uloborus diversus TaxID=327109 RepID=UPI00240906C9|nr:nephrin-like [Uloborus diversus]
MANGIVNSKKGLTIALWIHVLATLSTVSGNPKANMISKKQHIVLHISSLAYNIARKTVQIFLLDIVVELERSENVGCGTYGFDVRRHIPDSEIKDLSEDDEMIGHKNETVSIVKNGQTKGTRQYHAVAGGRVTMPCNISAPTPEDVVTLILWYKGDIKVPIYTLDARKGPIEKSKHFPSSKLGRRVHFDLHVKTPGLSIDPVKAEDEGFYKCRVEYKRYRTLSYTYDLKVIVPPREVIIMDEWGQRIEETVGPVDEGSNVTLICEAEGGSPSPAVTWWRDSILLDDTFFITTQGYVRNEMTLTRLRRSDLMAFLSCQASNNNLTVPTSNSVSLDLNLKPLDVRIISPPHHLSAGTTVMLECESTGSRPGALITWWKGSQKIQTGNEIISDNGNLTLSTYTFVPTADDHGKKFTCTAENPSLPHSTIDETKTITVHYLPELRLALGASIQYTAIKEGSDVYFDCNIRANPWVHDVSWRFQNKILFSNTSAGVIVSNQSLVLQRVKKEHRGMYQCVAVNSEGEGRSEEVLLDVQYSPVCKTKPGIVLGVARYETVNVTCDVDADPKDVRFKWTLNNTLENADLQDFISEATSSTVFYTPRAMLGYGVLLCFGSNDVGRQKEPCVFRIVPVGPPAAMRNCMVTNQTIDSLLVQCEQGHDGGLAQTFHLEIYASTDENLSANITSLESPIFLVPNLRMATSYILVLYAANAKGKSNSVAIVASTLFPAERRTAEEGDADIAPMIGILVGVAITLILLCIIIIVAVRMKSQRKDKDAEETKQVKSEMPLQNYKDDSLDSTIESPDVIPSDSQVYIADANSIHLECTRRMNDEMYKMLKKKQGQYDNLIPLSDTGHTEITEENSFTDLGVTYHRRSVPLHMEPPAAYADVYRRGTRTQVLPMPVSDALDKHALVGPELSLIGSVETSTMENVIHWPETEIDGRIMTQSHKICHDESTT